MQLRSKPANGQNQRIANRTAGLWGPGLDGIVTYALSVLAVTSIIDESPRIYWRVVCRRHDGYNGIAKRFTDGETGKNRVAVQTSARSTVQIVYGPVASIVSDFSRPGSGRNIS